MPLQDRFYLFFRNLFKHFFRWTESRLDRSTRDSKAIYSDNTMLSIKDFIPGGLTRWITWGKLDSLSTRLSLFAQISSFFSPLCRFKMCDLSKQVQLVNKHRAQQLWLPKPSSSIIRVRWLMGDGRGGAVLETGSSRLSWLDIGTPPLVSAGFWSSFDFVSFSIAELKPDAWWEHMMQKVSNFH